MAITYVASNTQDQAGARSLTFSIPGAATSGDLLLVFVKQSENTNAGIWADDGGGGRGYTRLAYNRYTSGRDQETAVYYKIHSGSETNPVFSWGGPANEPMSGTMLVYRGCDTVTPIPDFGYRVNQNDPNPPNPSVTISNATDIVVVFHAATHDDIQTVAAPTGFTLRTQVWNGTADDHRNHFTADLLSGLSPGLYTPPDWQHSAGNNTPEYQTYSVVLQEVQNIGVTDWDGDTNYGVVETISGFGFGASQGTGRVELWSDTSGTIKTNCPITSWADTSITFTSTRGSLSDDTVVYLVVFNDSGDQAGPYSAAVGINPYSVIIANQEPDHHWPLNDDGYSDIGVNGPNPITVSPINGGGSFVADPISEGTTHSWRCQTGQRREAPNSNFINGQTEQNRLMGGWIRLDTIGPGLACLYEEGGGVNNLAFYVGMGNVLIASFADSGDDNAQAFSDFSLEVGRAYHVMFRFSYTDPTKEFSLYIDGVKQSVTAGNPLTSATNDLDGHSGDISFGGPGGSLQIGGVTIVFQSVQDCLYSNWYTWATSKPQADITELFQRGAMPDDTIENQSELDAITATRGNAPLSLRVNSSTNDLDLDADGIVFPEEATLWVEWRGAGILTWTNLNGSNLRMDKVIATKGGSVTIVNPATLTLTGLQTNSEVRVYTAGTDTELGGIENSGATFATSVQVAAVDIVVLALGFQNLKLFNIATTSDTSLPIQQVIDRVYENP